MDADKTVNQEVVGYTEPGTHWYPPDTPIYYCHVCELKHPYPEKGCPNGPKGVEGEPGQE